MRIAFAFAAVAIAAGLLLAARRPQAKTCKDVVTAKARSAAQLSDASRERRAEESAIANWSRARARHLRLALRFWRRAEEQKVECGGGASRPSTARSAPSLAASRRAQ